MPHALNKQTTNWIMNTATRVVNTGASILFVPLILGIISVETYGNFVTYTAVAYIIGNLASLNSESINTARLLNSNDAVEMARSFAIPVQVKIITTILAVFGWLIISIFLFDDLKDRIFFIFCFYPILLRNFNLTFVAIAFQKFSFMFYGVLIEKLTIISSILLLNALVSYSFVIPLSFLLGVTCGVLFIFIIFRLTFFKDVNVSRLRVELKEYRKYFGSLKMSFLAKLTQPQVQLAKPICSFLLGSETVAFYDLIERMMNFCKMVGAVIFQTFLPRISLTKFAFLKLSMQVLLSVLIVFSIVIMFSTYVWEFLTGASSLGLVDQQVIGLALTFAMFCSLISSFNMVMGNGYLVMMKRDRDYYGGLVIINIVALSSLIFLHPFIESVPELFAWISIVEIAVAFYCLFQIIELKNKKYS